MEVLGNVSNLINKISELLGGGIATILMTVAFIAFLLAVINFIWKRRSGEANGMKQAGDMLWWSVFGLFVMVSVWGIVTFLATNLLGADANKTSVQKPQTTFGGPSDKKAIGQLCSAASECQSGYCKNFQGVKRCD